MIEDFEHIPLNLMLDGEDDNSAMTLVLNPDQGEANPGYYVIKFDRSQHGFSFGGFWSALPEPVDMTDMKYVHVQVWKPRISPLRFKVEGGPGGTFEFESMEPQTLTEEWETITFYFPDADGLYPVISFMPDFEDPLDLDEDIVMYFDNIVLSDSAVPGEGDELVIENFEFIGLNVMTDGENDNSTMTVIANPAPDDVNESNLVVEYFRSQHGFVFGGFWSALPEPVDMSENRYVYVDVWKPRISPLRFKIEGGPEGTFEVESMEPQTKVNEWETIVFHFPDADGEYPVIVFMPDFNDPLDLDEDIFIYFDNIRLGGAPDDDTSINDPILPVAGINLKVFPNPAREQVTVETLPNSLVTLIDITGNVIRQQVSSGSSTSITLDGLSKGIYLVRVVNGEHARTTKLMVQ
ncbi:MAG: T9SS C-terminal target domain-containing protein [Bacteroidetes bacterium]|nr:MAG: T9SS C-terminal target domain-containing protein [Bacteroidota bacterium]